MLVFAALASISRADDSTNGLVLWNKLGSNAEVTNSVIGPDPVIVGTLRYQSGKFGNGVSPGTNNGIRFDPTKMRGYNVPATYEMWIRTPETFEQREMVLMWSHQASSGLNGISFSIDATGRLLANITNKSYDDFFIAQVLAGPLSTGRWYHVALAWDFVNTIDGVDTFRCYVDGEITFRSSVTRTTLYPFGVVASHDNFALGNHGYNRMWNGGFSGVIDNFKVWNYARTNFSDRLSEGEDYLLLTVGAKPASSGSLDIGDGWHTNGASVTVTAAPAIGYQFSLWSGDVPAGNSANNPLTLTMDRARSISAVFVEDTADIPQGLVLWNTLGSAAEVTNSVVGPDPVMIGSLNYGTGKFGMGVSPGTNNGIRFDPTRMRGYNVPATYEMWVKTPDAFGPQDMLLLWSHQATNGLNGLGLRIDANGRLLVNLTNKSHDDFFINQTLAGPLETGRWYHVALAWDFVNTIDGTDTVRCYVDGAITFRSSVTRNVLYSFGVVASQGNFALGNHGQNGMWNGGFRGIIDNFKVWNYARTDFSDRSFEDPNYVTLAVNGSPAAYGASAPFFYGTNRVARTATITNVVNSPVSGGAGMRYVCTGWTGAGDIPSSGSATSVAFTATTNSTLTWQWRTEYRSEWQGASGKGQVDESSGWHTNGASVAITATASNGYRFAMWSGDVPAGQATNNPLTVTMDRARSVSAVFVEDGLDAQEGLVLWNTLGSAVEVLDSVVGPDPVIIGNLNYGIGKFGMGVSPGTTNGIRFDPTKMRGCDVPATYEMWIRTPESLSSDGYLIWSHQGVRIAGLGLRTDTNMFLYLNLNNEADDALLRNAQLAGPLATGRWYHVALVWDFVNTIDGTDTFRCYVDGEITFRSSVTRSVLYPFGVVTSQGNFAFGNHGQNGTGNGGFPGIIDNFKVWNYAKTNFMDRFSETKVKINDGLVLRYTFDEGAGTNVYDVSGNGHHAVATGVTRTVAGASADALVFDSSNSWMELSETGINLVSNFTVCAWVKPTHGRAYGYPIVEKTSQLSQSTRSVEFFFDGCAGDLTNAQLFAYFWNSSTKYFRGYCYVPTVFDGGWHMVAVQHDASLSNHQMRMYVDSVEQTLLFNYETVSSIPEIRQVAVPWRVGCQVSAARDRYFWGAIDEVSIYSRVLSVSEIQGLYDRPTPRMTMLAVAGSPVARGVSLPYGYGSHYVAASATITNAVISPALGMNGARHMCAGWTGAGDVPSSGTGTSVVFTITTNSTLTWNWVNEYYLDTASGSHGSVNVSDGWRSDGASVTITATASNGYYFSQWSGDAPSGSAAANPLTVTMDRARTLTAQFVAHSRAVAGRVYYHGSQAGAIYVEAFYDKDYVIRAGWARINAPGAYFISPLSAGKNYWIRAFVDANANGRLDGIEAAGSYNQNPVALLALDQRGVDVYLGRLSAPRNVSARGAVGAIVVFWSPNPEPGIAGYNVYRFNSEWGQFERLNAAPVPDISFTDESVEAGKTYYYYVSAVIRSDQFAGYLESPASAIVGASAGAISLWMPDYFGNTGAVARLRINASDAAGILGDDMAIAVSYNPAILIPISQVNSNRATVEKTPMTARLTVTDNGLIATGRIEITASAGVTPTNYATLRILGTAYERTGQKPIPIKATYSLDGGQTWKTINDGKDVNKGVSYAIELGELAAATNCIVRVREEEKGHERRSDEVGSYVKVLKDGEYAGRIPGFGNRQDVRHYLRGHIDDDMITHIGSNDVVYLFELGDSEADSEVDYQDVVARVEFNKGRGLAGQGRLFDVVFSVAGGIALGTKQTNAFISASFKDRNGNSVNVDYSDTAVFAVQSAYMLGDVNGDGTVTVSGDFTLAMKLAVGQREPTESELTAGDIDGDGAVTKLDATLIKRIALGLPINPSEEETGDAGPGGYEISIGSLDVQPGASALVPVLIDKATNVASLDLRVNFDSDILSLLSVTNSALTSSFDMEYLAGAGYVDIAMSSSNNLLSGSGAVLYLNFLVGSEADIGAMSDFTIVRKKLGNQYGKDLELSAGVNASNGTLAVSLSDSVDSDGDGLTDREEQYSDGKASYNAWHESGNPYGADTDATNPDTDGDGMLDGHERRAGMDGRDKDSVFRVRNFEPQAVSSQQEFRVEWSSVTGKYYTIEGCTNLIEGFRVLASNVPGDASAKMYADTNTVGVANKFYRIKLEE